MSASTSASAASPLLQNIDRQTRLAGHNRLALLLFRLGGGAHRGACYGVNVFKVQEVIQCPAILRVPEAHARVLGVARVRGRTLPILDLSAAMDEAPPAGAGFVIVTEFNRSIQGFRVGGVDRIVNVAVETVTPPPLDLAGSRLTAVTRCGEELVQIIDLEQILAEVVGGPRDVSAAVRERIPPVARSARVLVADDSRVARSQVGRILDQLGVDSVQVGDGRQALKYLQGLADSGKTVAEELALVISDIEMPDMDGYTLTTEIRRDPRLAGLYVLLHTSLSGGFNHAMVDKVGANRFIPKFSPDELAQAVLKVLDAQGKVPSAKEK